MMTTVDKIESEKFIPKFISLNSQESSTFFAFRLLPSFCYIYFLLTLLSLLFFFSSLLISCGTKRVDNFPKAEEDIVLPPPPQPLEGSLFYDGSPFMNLYSDIKARRVGDIVMVKVQENVLTSNEQRKDMSRNSNMNYGLGASLGKTGKILGGSPFEGIALGAEAGGKNDFKSKGVMENKNRFIAVVAARVIKVLPNGDLVVEGEKYIRQNSEVQKIYVKGIVRPEDIGNDNSVPSSSLANARIEYVSDGDFADNSNQGWLQKILKFIFPF